MPIMASIDNTGAKAFAASGNVGNIKRKKPYVPIFSKIPAKIIEPPVGASTWASGSHVWKGNMGTFTAKPAKKAKNIHHCNVVGKLACYASTRTSKVRGSKPELMYRDKMTTSIF